MLIKFDLGNCMNVMQYVIRLQIIIAGGFAIGAARNKTRCMVRTIYVNTTSRLAVADVIFVKTQILEFLKNIKHVLYVSKRITTQNTMGVGAGLYVYVVVVQKFTFAISSPDEFLYNYG